MDEEEEEEEGGEDNIERCSPINSTTGKKVWHQLTTPKNALPVTMWWNSLNIDGTEESWVGPCIGWHH